jgi:hypothetical protein
MQNYMDIGKKTIAELNSTALKASPSLFKGGGARGWLPIKGAIFRSKTKTTAFAVAFSFIFQTV